MSSIKLFESKVLKIPFTSCHIWSGHSENGYGRFGVKINNKFKMEWAHRFSYKTYKGEIPDGLTIDHTCMNKICVNPDHLRVVTRSENTKLMHKNKPKSNICINGHELIEKNTITRKSGQKVCRKCKNAWDRNWKAKKRERNG